MGQPDPDLQLLAAVRGGDRRALDDLLRRHQPRLWAVCRRLTGSDADADDATQEALVSIVRALPRFDGRSRFGTWTYRIAVNASLDELRRRRRRPDPGLPGDHDGPPGPEPVATADLPEGAALTADVDAALRRLPPEFRAPVVLRDLCGLDYAEIAEVLELPPGTVRSRISRGRAALAPLLHPGPGPSEGSPPAREAQHSPPAPEAKHSPPAREAKHAPPAPEAKHSPPAPEAKHSPPAPGAGGSRAGSAGMGNPNDPAERRTP